MIIREDIDIASIETVIQEATNNGPKKYIIVGPYLEAESKNQNGRIYPKAILEKQVSIFTEDKIKQNRAMGELGHPDTTEINLDRVSHIIKGFVQEGNMFIGKSEILDTAVGKTVKALIDGGVKLGVSSRGTGTLKESIVQNDYKLVTVDIVAEPSVKKALVDCVLESKREWVLENGILVEKDLEEIENKLKNFETSDVNRVIDIVFNDFYKKITKNGNL